MSASVVFPQVRGVTLMGSSPARPTSFSLRKRSDLRKRGFLDCFRAVFAASRAVLTRCHVVAAHFRYV